MYVALLVMVIFMAKIVINFGVGRVFPCPYNEDFVRDLHIPAAVFLTGVTAPLRREERFLRDFHKRSSSVLVCPFWGLKHPFICRGNYRVPAG